MCSGGFRSCVCIPRAELAARRDVEHATNPAIAYEPLLTPSQFYYLSYNQSIIINLFNRSTALSRYVRAGRAGRLFCKPFIYALACVGLQMCLTAKGRECCKTANTALDKTDKAVEIIKLTHVNFFINTGVPVNLN